MFLKSRFKIVTILFATLLCLSLFAAFGFGHVFEGVEAIAFIEALYFDNPDRVAGIHDKVQLVVFAAPVAGDECHAKFLQVIQRGLLSRASECNLFHAAR